jgi:hypothetical protein
MIFTRNRMKTYSINGAVGFHSDICQILMLVEFLFVIEMSISRVLCQAREGGR